MPAPFMFQFLIGTLKTSLQLLTGILRHLWFQFLIGTLKTIAVGFTCHSSGEFQFLIGTLKTTIPPSAVFFTFWFQFLIGTLKTAAQRIGGARMCSFNSS